MAFKKNNFGDLIGIISLVILFPLTATTNIDCNGKAFHCVNATHFMICVDLGSGISTTIDDFVIPCPPRTMCQKTNRFECEFAPVTLPSPTPSSQVKSVQTSATATSPSTTTKTISTVEVNTESTSNAVNTSNIFDILTQSTESVLDATFRNNRSANYTEINVTVEPIFDVTTVFNIGNDTAITVEAANMSDGNIPQQYDINAEIITSPSEQYIPLSKLTALEVSSSTDAINILTNSVTNADEFYNGIQNNTEYIAPESTTRIFQTGLFKSTTLSELTSVEMPVTTEAMISILNDSSTNVDESGLYNVKLINTEYTALESTTPSISQTDLVRSTILSELTSVDMPSTTETMMSVFNDSATNVDGFDNDTENITQYTTARESTTPSIHQTDLVSSTIISDLKSDDVHSTTESIITILNESASNVNELFNGTQNNTQYTASDSTAPNIPQTNVLKNTILSDTLTSVEVPSTTEVLMSLLNGSLTDGKLNNLVNNVDGYSPENNTQYTVSESLNTSFSQTDLVKSTMLIELTPFEVPSTTEAMKNILNNSVTNADGVYNDTQNNTLHTTPESIDTSFAETDLVRSTILSELMPDEVASTTEAMMSISNDSVTTHDVLQNHTTTGDPQADLFRSNERGATTQPSFTDYMITTSFNSNQSSTQRDNTSLITHFSPTGLNNTGTSESNNFNKSEEFFSNTNTDSLITSTDNLISNITKIDESTITTESVPIYFSTDAPTISPDVATGTTPHLHQTNTESYDIHYPNTMETTEGLTEVRNSVNALFGNTGTVANDILIKKENNTYNVPTTMPQSTFVDLPESTQLPLLLKKDIIHTATDLFTTIDQKTITENILINETRRTTSNDTNIMQNNNSDNTKEIEQDFNGTINELPHIFDSSNFITNNVSPVIATSTNMFGDKTDEQISQKQNMSWTHINSPTNLNIDSNYTKHLSENKSESTLSVTNLPEKVTEPSVPAFKSEFTSTVNNNNFEYATKYVTATTDAYTNYKQNDNLPITISTNVFTIDNIEKSINITGIISQSADMTTSFPEIDNSRSLHRYTQNIMENYTTTESYSASTLEKSQTTLDKSMTPEEFIAANPNMEESTPVPSTNDIELASTIPVTASIHGLPSVNDFEEFSNTQTFIPLTTLSKDPTISTSQTTKEMSQMVTTQNSLKIDGRTEGIMTETTANEMRLEHNTNIITETPVIDLKITNNSSIDITPLLILTRSKTQNSLNTEHITEGTMVATTAINREIPSQHNDKINMQEPVTDLKINNKGGNTLSRITASKTQNSLNMEQLIAGVMLATTPVYQEIPSRRYDNNIATETPDTDLNINNNSGILLQAILTSTVHNSLHIDQRTESTTVTEKSAYQEIISERNDDIITETPVTDLNINSNGGIGSEVSFKNNLTENEQKIPLSTLHIESEFKHGNGITASSTTYLRSTANKSTQDKTSDINSDSEVKYQTEVQTQNPEMPMIEASVTFDTLEQRSMSVDTLINKQESTSTSNANILNSNSQSTKIIEPISIAIAVHSNIKGLSTPTVSEVLVTSTTTLPILNDSQNDNTISTQEMSRVTTSGNLAINGIYTQTAATKSETISTTQKSKDLSFTSTTSYESQSIPTSTQTLLNNLEIGDGHPETLRVNNVSDVIPRANNINIQTRTDPAITGQGEGIHNKASTYSTSNLGTLDPVQILPRSLLPIAFNSSNDQVLKSAISTSKIQTTQETLNSTKQSASQKTTSSQIDTENVHVSAQNNDRTHNQAKETTISRPAQVSDINNTNTIGTRGYKNHPISEKPESNNTNRVTANEAQFSCLNHGRGRYGDNKECRKFYICVGRYQPIVGICPINTVFSEIRKQCTNNLSHCIRNNQFLCTSEGRFGDYIKDNTYYICVKDTSNTFMRFRLQCTNGYYLNTTTVKCEIKPKDASASTVSNTSKTSKSSNSDSASTSEQSKASIPNESQKKSNEKFECDEEGKFADPNNCRKYYYCYRNKKNEFRMKKKKCESEEIFDDDKQKCTENSSRGC